MIDMIEQSRIRDLRKIIRHHRLLYYNDMPQIPDDEFDAYIDELTLLDPSDPVLFEVGAPPLADSGWITGLHHLPMASLSKVNTESDMSAWVQKTNVDELIIQDKLDGLSISLDYKQGTLVRCLTRGDGIKGEDVTRNVAQSSSVVQTIPGFTGSIRAEAMLFEAGFQNYNIEADRQGWNIFKNRRNGASGLTRRLSGDGIAHLQIVCFDVEGSIDFESHQAKLVWLAKQGMKVPFSSVGNLAKILLTFANRANERASLDYDIDGMVVKVNNLHASKIVEINLDNGGSSRNPKSQIAWKFQDETRVTTILDIEWGLGKSGRITPVGILSPVNIQGVTIKRASLHNWSNIQNLNLRKNARVIIKRANEVIPQIVQCVSDGTEDFVYPLLCPECQQTTSWDGEYLVCLSLTCKSRLVGNIRKWVLNLEIDHIGDRLIESLVDAGLVHTVADLYRLTIDDMLTLERVGQGVAERALRNLHSQRTIPLWLLFGSLNVAGFGRSLAKKVVKEGYDTCESFLSITQAQLIDVPKFGIGRSELVYNSLQTLRPLVEDLLQFIEIETPVKLAGSQLTNNAVAGKSFCITGSLSRPKKEWMQEIESLGGEYKMSVQKDLDYLICADLQTSSSKTVKAQKLGITIIDESRLLQMIKGNTK